MLVKSIKLNEYIFSSETFFIVSLINLILFSVLTAYNSRFKFPLMQSALINLSCYMLFLYSILLYNEDLSTIKLTSFFNSICSDYLSFVSKTIITITSIICLIFIKDYIIKQKINKVEYTIILLFSILGLLILCSANDLLTVYLGMELQSLSFYLLAAYKKNSSYSVDAGLKYFILGSFSSSLFLFGSSFIYLAYGSINFDDISLLSHHHLLIRQDYDGTYASFTFWFELINRRWFEMTNSPSGVLNYYSLLDYEWKFENFVITGLLLIFFSLFFKLSLAPFHLWSPDVYENSPTSSSFFFAVVPKISILVVLVRLLYSPFLFTFDSIQELLLLISVFSVMAGSLGGIYQRKMKSLLAYSSISHMGYLMISLSSGSLEGFQMLFCYLIVYTITGLCIWSVIIMIRLKKTDHIKQNKDLADFALLCKSNYVLALIFMSSLFSVAGIPPLVGFIAKMNIFLVAIKNKFYIVSIISVLFSVISTFFYLRLIKIMYFESLLVGRLYFPIESFKVFIIILLFFSLVLFFINPTFLYLLSFKISHLFM